MIYNWNYRTIKRALDLNVSFFLAFRFLKKQKIKTDVKWNREERAKDRDTRSILIAIVQGVGGDTVVSIVLSLPYRGICRWYGRAQFTKKNKKRKEKQEATKRRDQPSTYELLYVLRKELGMFGCKIKTEIYILCSFLHIVKA